MVRLTVGPETAKVLHLSYVPALRPGILACDRPVRKYQDCEWFTQERRVGMNLIRCLPKGRGTDLMANKDCCIYIK